VALTFPYRGAARFILRLAVPLQELDAAVAAVRWWLLGTSLVALILGMLIAYVFSMRFSGRIRHLQSFAERLVETKASKEIWSEADDELGSLAFVEPHGSSIAQLLRPVEHGVGAA
jgi:hypothetical protein